MAGRLLFWQIRKKIDLEVKSASIAGISTVPVSKITVMGMDFEFGFGLQSRQLNIALLLRQASFSGAVCLPHPGLLVPIGGFGEYE